MGGLGRFTSGYFWKSMGPIPCSKGLNLAGKLPDGSSRAGGADGAGFQPLVGLPANSWGLAPSWNETDLWALDRLRDLYRKAAL